MVLSGLSCWTKKDLLNRVFVFTLLCLHRCAVLLFYTALGSESIPSTSHRVRSVTNWVQERAGRLSYLSVSIATTGLAAYDVCQEY